MFNMKNHTLAIICFLYKQKMMHSLNEGVTLAQLVKASVGQADVQRLEPHLRHNWF